MQPDPTLEERAKEVGQVGGAAALAIAVLGAPTANLALQALILGLMGGRPELDAEGASGLIDAFLVTAPLAIAVAIASFGFVRIEFTGEKDMLKVLVFVAVALVVGLVVGAGIYQEVYGLQLSVNAEDLGSTLNRAPRVWYVQLGTAVTWLLVGYYEFFGFNHFVIAFIAGGFAAYAAHRLMRPGTLASL